MVVVSISSLGKMAAIALVLARWFGNVPAAGAEEKVKVTVVAVLATENNKHVDPQLKCLADEVRKIEPKLTGFRTARATCKSLAVNEEFKFPLVDKEVASVLVQHGADKDDQVGLTVKAPQVGEIVYTSACGKFFPIVTRYQTKDKDRLIIMIRVQPCKGKKEKEKKEK